VIRIEGTTRDGLRIIGALTGTVLRRILEMKGGAEVVLDLSEVSEADAANVRLLARLADGHCKLVNCPQWLGLWIDRERRPPPIDGSEVGRLK
jgi:ABC-type transporter Mla MlaB component